MVPTRVHERYGYPFFAMGVILAAISVRWRIAYIVLSVATFANMYVVLTTIYPNNPSIADWLRIGPTIRDPAGVVVLSLLHGVAFVWAFVQLRSGAHRRLGDELLAASVVDEADRADDELLEDDTGLLPGPAAAPLVATAADAGRARRGRDHGRGRGGRHSRVTRRARGAGGRRPAASPRPGPGRCGHRRDRRAPQMDPAPRLRSARGHRLVPVPPDRGAAPARPQRPAARRGRRPARQARPVDRRGPRSSGPWSCADYRLAEPYQMHFDEVYHARTATEFLQAWRYGISHDIYEWTHPHLAKYAMAGGLVLWGQDDVSAMSDLGVPVVAATVEPRRDRRAGARWPCR